MKYINIYRNVNTEIGGRELKNLGVKEGPIYKKLIRKVLYAKLDGRVKTKADEIRYISKQYAVSNRQGEDTTENDHVNFMSKP
jgi:tRNA nucleotidyltransferase (CCA-adding enzyme)